MAAKRTLLLTALLLAAAACTTLIDAPTPSPGVAAAPGAHGWLLCLSTDLPIYHPGGGIQARVLVLDCLTRVPCRAEPSIVLRLEDPRGTNVATILARATDGIASATIVTASDWPAGSYRLKAGTSGVPATPVERRLQLSSSHLPALDLEVQATPAEWSPGGTVAVTLHAWHFDGRPAAACRATIVASCAGTEVVRTSAVLSAEGAVAMELKMPPTAAADAQLGISVDDQGVLTTASRSLPIRSPPTVEFIPESGQLVAGLPNRLYLQACRHPGAPLAIAGTIEDGDGKALAHVTTEVDGRGSVTFIPSTRACRLRLSQPAGCPEAVALPPVSPSGVVLRSLDQRCAAGEPLRLELASSVAQELRLEVSQRDALVASQRIACQPGIPVRISCVLPATADGVLVVTACGMDGSALAERLVYREPLRRLFLRLIPDHDQHRRGEEASVTVEVRDERGRPAAALVSLAVVDGGGEAALERDLRPPQLTVMALLEGEVDHLGDPASYLAGTPSGDAALDRLLACQSWRRFLLQEDPAGVRAALARRLVPVRPPWQVWPRMLPEIPGRPVPALCSRRRGAALESGDIPEQTRLLPLPHGEPTLNWMRRHQEADGSWDPAAPHAGIWRDASETGITPWTGRDARLSATALSALAFLGAGYDHLTPNKYRAMMAQALKWLAGQARDGDFSRDPSVQGAVTECLCEAFAMTSDVALKDLCQRAVAVILARQVQLDGKRLGWAAEAGDAPVCDADASQWSVRALKSALAGGLETRDGLEGAKRYLDLAWADANQGGRPETTSGYSTFPARWDPRSGECRQPQLPAAGLFMAIFLGHHAGELMPETLANHACDRYFPASPPLEPFDNFLTTVSIFMLDPRFPRAPSRWERWNAAHLVLITELLRLGSGEEQGSIDPRYLDAAGIASGRSISTALACLSLETYYRYRSSGQEDQAPAADGPRPPVADASDIATTVYWNDGVRSDAATGMATMRFKTPNRMADFRIRADAIDARGALGIAAGVMVVGEDLALSAEVPERLQCGDQVTLPVTIRDRRRNPAHQVELVVAPGQHRIIPLVDGIGRVLVPLRAGGPGELPVDLSIDSQGQNDRLQRSITVTSSGFPWTSTDGGIIPRGGDAETVVTVPADRIAGATQAWLTIYPSAQARLTQGFAALLKEPHGCFEQVASTCYPLAMAEQLMQKSDSEGGSRHERARQLLTEGYRKLSAYACPLGGFSLWGKDPGDPALTAYGLMLFRDLGKAVAVEAAMVARARFWLLDQRTPDGVFADVQSGLQGRVECFNAYIVWALLESSPQPLESASGLYKALDALEGQARTSGNAYVIALGANALLLAGRTAEARAAMERVHCNGHGAVIGATSSLLSDAKLDIDVQATALAVLAWLRLGLEEPVLPAVGYLCSCCRDGSFGTTQATVLALRALTLWQQRQPAPAGPGTRIAVSIDGRQLPELVVSDGRVLRCGLADGFAIGPHRIIMHQVEGAMLSWSLQVEGSTRTPAQHCDDIVLATGLGRNHASFGDPVMVNIGCRLTHEIRTPVAVVGIPGGLRVDGPALDELVRSGRMSAWEQNGSQLVLYWDRLSPDAPGNLDGYVLFDIPCQAVLPGSFTAPASSMYAYYEPDQRSWSEPLVYPNPSPDDQQGLHPPLVMVG